MPRITIDATKNAQRDEKIQHQTPPTPLPVPQHLCVPEALRRLRRSTADEYVTGIGRRGGADPEALVTNEKCSIPSS
jgi:hypothetical protein